MRRGSEEPADDGTSKPLTAWKNAALSARRTPAGRRPARAPGSRGADLVDLAGGADDVEYVRRS